MELDVIYNKISILLSSIGALQKLQRLRLEWNPMVFPLPDMVEHSEHNVEAVKHYLGKWLMKSNHMKGQMELPVELSSFKKNSLPWKHFLNIFSSIARRDWSLWNFWDLSKFPLHLPWIITRAIHENNEIEIDQSKQNPFQTKPMPCIPRLIFRKILIIHYVFHCCVYK